MHHYYGAAQLSFVGWGRDAESLRPFPEVDIDVRDGELWVTSPWLCLREEGDPAVLRREIRDGRQWMTVGDRGSVTADGRLVVAGRADAVTTGGATVVLADVEAALRPYARGEVVVVGRPHPRLGAVLVAVCTDPVDVADAAGDRPPGAAVQPPATPLVGAGGSSRSRRRERWTGTGSRLR